MSSLPKPLSLTRPTHHFSQTVSHISCNQVIGAACYIALEKFDEGIADCDKAIEINDKFVKVIILLTIISFRLITEKRRL